MQRFLIPVFTACLLLVGCGGGPASPVGDPCQVDEDCLGFCLTQLEGEWQGEWQVLDFPDGMCSDACETPGAWTESNICLLYSPTGDQYLFPSCRGSFDCRADEGYSCLVIGYDEFFQPTKACLPPGV